MPVLEAVEGPVGLQERLLDEVLGVGRIAGHAQGGGVQRRHVLHGELCEATPDRPCVHPTHRLSGRLPGSGDFGCPGLGSFRQWTLKVFFDVYPFVSVFTKTGPLTAPWGTSTVISVVVDPKVICSACTNEPGGVAEK